MIFNMDSIGKYMLEIILHQQRTPHLLKQKKLMQTQEDHSNPIPALNVDSLKVGLVDLQNTLFEKEDSTHIEHGFKRAFTSLFGQDADTFTRTMFLKIDADEESKIDTGKAVDAGLVVTKSSGTKSEVQDNNSRSGNDTDADDVDIRPIYDEEPMTKKTKSAFAKPDHMIASSSSRNSSKNMPRFSSNDRVHYHYLNKAKKKTQERDRNSKTSVMTLARFKSTADDSKPKPKSTNHSSRSLPISKSICVTIMTMPRSDHSKSPSSFSDSKHFVYSTCNKWKPTSKTFKSVGLRWIPTGKLFDSSTSKVDSEPPHGSNVDILTIHECKQTLDISAGTSVNVQKEQSLDLNAGTLCNVNKENLGVWLLKKLIS
uniref:Uncharacterized protein n=1 Tax=Tanacetum cinerariifolium TaxID=118510 RepID=A0A6L2MY34_TANCI|nr:hypothetical protein [Tanacetum cinerariifolium]